MVASVMSAAEVSYPGADSTGGSRSPATVQVAALRHTYHVMLKNKKLLQPWLRAATGIDSG